MLIGRVRTRLVEACLDRAAIGQGPAALRMVHGSQARTAAAEFGRSASACKPLCGIPISVKDNIGEAGQLTLAGSKIRLGRPVAVADAAAVARLRAAGAILTGRAAISEFAYAGDGTYAHLGTPLNPFDRVTRRIPGGSSSGAAITVTDGVRLRRSAPIPAAPCAYRRRFAGWSASRQSQQTSE
jgi:aspartyl-tRNA(Asn)/glutamyl-tRNA(Gln) amidotransferase subunit A